MSLVTKTNIFGMEIRPVPVSNELVHSTVNDSKIYTNISSEIPTNITLTNCEGNRHMGIWSPNLLLSSSDAIQEIGSMTTIIGQDTYEGSPATIEEMAAMAAYRAEFPDEFKHDGPLLALGEKIHDSFGEEICDDEGFHLVLVNNRTEEWSKNYCFLVVWKKVVK